MIGLGLTISISDANPLVSASFAIGFTGLTSGEARPGDTIGYTIDPDNGTDTAAWGTVVGDDSYGTGATVIAPTTGNLVLTVTDGGETTDVSAPIRYAPGTAPVVADGQTWTVDDTSVNIDGSASGANLTWTYALSGSTAGVTINTSTGAITGTPTGVDSGTATITATDQYGRTVQDTFTWTSALRAQATGGADLDLAFVASAAISSTDLAANWTLNGNTLTYAITGTALPSALSVSSAGLMTGTPASVTADATYTLRGTDEYGRITDDTFTLEVTAAGPTLDLTSATWTTGTGGVANSLALVHSYSGTDTNLIAVISLLSSATVPTQAQMEAETGNVDETIQVAFTGSPIDIASSFTIAGNTNFAVLLKEEPGTGTAVTDVETGTMTAVDFVAPTLSSSVPADNATGIAVGVSPALTFNKAVFFDTGNITLRDNDGGFADLELFDVATEVGTGAGQVSIAGSVLTINPTADFANSIEHAIRIASTALVSDQGIPFAGIADDTTLSFTSAAGAPASLFDDTFVRADENLTAGANYTLEEGTASLMRIVSNELIIDDNSGAGTNSVAYRDGTFPDDMAAELYVTSKAGLFYIGVGLRGTGTFANYAVYIDNENSQFRFTEGFGTWSADLSYAAAEAIDPAIDLDAAFVLRLEVVGDTQRALINDIEIATGTNTGIASGGEPMLLGNFVGGTPNLVVSRFRGEDLT